MLALARVQKNKSSKLGEVCVIYFILVDSSQFLIQNHTTAYWYNKAEFEFDSSRCFSLYMFLFFSKQKDFCLETASSSE